MREEKSPHKDKEFAQCWSCLTKLSRIEVKNHLCPKPPQETSPKECCDECRLPAESKFLCKGTCPCHTSSNEENGYEKKHCPNCKLDFLGIGFDSECPECETKFIAPSLEWEEQIKNWQFAACPTEESEPFYWKWTEHGMEMLKTYVKEI